MKLGSPFQESAATRKVNDFWDAVSKATVPFESITALSDAAGPRVAGSALPR